MRVRIVGSGTLVPDPARGCSAHWVEGRAFRALLDCGPGAVRSMARLNLAWHALDYLVITHFHTDHVGEIAYLFFVLRNAQPSPREKGLVVLGPEGLRDHLDALARAHGDHISDPGFPVAVQEISAGEGWVDRSRDFHLLTRATAHTANSLAVRIETANGALGYTGDTGPSRDLAPFFRGCDLLIAECSNPDGVETDNHLTPGGLAELVLGATPDTLVTVHSYPGLEPATIPPLLEAAGFQGQVLTGWDGLGLDLAADGVNILGPETG